MNFLRISTAFLACGALALAGCDGTGNTPPTQTDIGFAHRFPLKLGTQTVNVQVALSEIEKSNGLMHRRQLAENEGMLFVFPRSQTRAFWMRNVPINLALAYLTEDGKIDEILTLHAEDPTDVPSRSDRIRYVLEMPENWFEKNDIRVGDRLDMTGVRDAVNARGYLPEKFLPAAKTHE